MLSMCSGSTFKSADALANSSSSGRYVWPFPVAWSSIEKSAADPVIGIREDPDLRRDLVRDLKSHPLDIVRQLIRISWITEYIPDRNAD